MMKERQKPKTKATKAKAKPRKAAKAVRLSGASADSLRKKLALFKRERDEALEQQAATSELLQVIGSSKGELQPVFQAMLASAMRLCGASHGRVWLREADGFRSVAQLGRYPKAYREKWRIGTIVRLGADAPIARAARTRKAVQVPDLAASSAYRDGNPLSVAAADVAGIRTFLAVPMLKDGECVGSIALGRQQVSLFSDNQIGLVANFAGQAVIAIENARLFNETKDALERQTATADVLKVIASSPTDVQPVFDAIAERSNRLIGGHSAAVLRFVGGTVELAAFTLVNPAADAAFKASYPRDVSRSQLFELASQGRAVEISDIEAESLSSAPLSSPKLIRDLARLRGFRSMLLTPLRGDDGPIGMISVTRKEPGTFASRDIQLLQTFADQAVIAIQNVKLFDEVQAKTRDLEESLQQQMATADVLKVISRSTFDLQSVLNTLTESAVRLTDARQGVLFRLEDGLLHVAAHLNFEGTQRQLLLAGYPMKPSNGTMSGRAILRGIATQIPDILVDPEYQSTEGKDAGFRSLLGVPLLRNGQAIGSIVIFRMEPGEFSDKQLALVQTFVDQAVIAIENARLINETREALERQTATAEVLKVIASSPTDVQPVFEAIVASATRLIGGFSTAAYRFADGIAHLTAFTQINPAADEALIASFPRSLVDAPLFQAAAESGEVVQIPDSQIDTLPWRRELARLRGFRSQLLVPLKGNGATIGIISVTRKEPGSFPAHHVNLLQTFADQAVIAIQNVGLFEQVQAKSRDLAESLQQQTATADVLKVISRSTFDLDSVLKTLAHSAARLCGATAVNILLREGDLLWSKTTSGLSEPFADRARKHPTRADRGSTTGRAFLTGEIVHIPDTLADPEYALAQATREFRTGLAVPMIRDGRVEGVFGLAKRDAGGFSPREIELVRVFADQAVIAIENVRLFNGTQEALERQTATADILRVIASSPSDLQPVFDAIAERSNRLIGGHAASVIRFVGDTVELAAFTSFNDAVDAVLRASFPQPLKDFPLFQLVRGGEVAQVTDTETETRLPPLRKELSRTAGFRSILLTPLAGDNGPIGMIAVTRKEPGSFAAHHVNLLQTFADQAVIAIQNVGLFEQVQAKSRDLTESLQFQTASSDVLKVISRSPDTLQPVLDCIVNTSRELCGSQNSTFFLLRDGTLHLAAVAGAWDDILTGRKSNPRKVDQKGAILARAIREKRTVHVPNTAEDPESAYGNLWTEEPRALLSVPLILDGQVIGGITLRKSHLTPFTARQIEAIETFADQALIAISNVNLFEQVQQRTRELSQSLDDLRTAQDRLIQTEKLASLGQLTAGIAHEIKNPLNFVNNFSALSAELIDDMKDILSDVSLDRNKREELDEITQLLKSNLDKVVQHGKRADSIVKNMLLHSREGSGEHRQVGINALVDESLNLAYHGARAEKPGFNITMQRNFDPAVGEADVYPQEITRVLLNLISNGFYAATKRKTDADDAFEPMLSAATKSLGDRIEIHIRDNGTGIPPEVRDKMFNPFFTTKPAGEGTGLGLSMSYDIIVKQHGGSIDVETEPGQFTQFTIVLPRKNNLFKQD